MKTMALWAGYPGELRITQGKLKRTRVENFTDKKTDKKRVFIKTFGCQMNEYDSEKMLEQLKEQNFTEIKTPEGADLILVNTCAIREKAEHKVYSLLGSFEDLKQENPALVIGVGGCVAQQKGKRILSRARNVDLVFGTDNLFQLPQMLDQVATGKRVLNTEWSPRPKSRVENFIPRFDSQGIASEEGENPIKAHLAITKGCNNFCSFCVVPHTRGREVSREAEDILQEAEKQVASGVREITLLGQNVNSYKTGDVSFVALLEKLNQIPDLLRIRYTSPHPKDLKPELAQAHKNLSKLAPHMHLPLQSGSSKILKAMKRNHTRETYLEKVAMLREALPHIALTTDFIVGFPGEEEADFQETLDVITQVGFDQIYAFKYSQREDTPASTYSNQVSKEVSRERLARLHETHEEWVEQSHGALAGKTQEVLVECPHPRQEGAVFGRTGGNKPFTVLESNAEPGTLVQAVVETARKFSLSGREV